MGKKQLIKGQILLLIFIILFLGKWFASRVLDTNMDNRWFKSGAIKEYEIALGETKNIFIDLVSEDVEVYEIEGEQILIKQRINGFKEDALLDINQQGDTLSIKRPMRHFFNFNFFSSRGIVQIYMPKMYISSLDIETVSGDITIKGGTIEKLALQTTSGDCEVRDILCSRVEIYTTSGEVEYEGEVETLDIESTSGDVEIELKSSIEEVDIKTVSGNVEIECLKNEPYRISFDSISGELEGSKHYSYGEAGGEITIRTVSGDGKLRIR